ncbi:MULTISPECIES: type III polyketide synthase [unclassified Cyanobium]|uniref:type III polyketide synthase n=1 Tax=unclassified Cyanobium TaxID=2627006 RepID=UPI0020CCA578|nr:MULTISPECIES: naringenin-chalcone synthase [unclassified Cyanobium]
MVTGATLKQLEVECILSAPQVYIQGIASGAPAARLSQKDAAAFMGHLDGMEATHNRIETIFEHTRINERHLAYSLLEPGAASFLREHGTLETRMAMYESHALPLAERVARAALEDATCSASDIQLVVFVSSTGFVAPGVDAFLIRKLGLNLDTARHPVLFMGCAAALVGLRIASDHVRAHPGNGALVVCLELSSLNASLEDDLNDVIIHSIFGDGCAAVVLRSTKDQENIPKGRAILHQQRSVLAPDTEEGIVLGIRDNGITCTLSRHLPEMIGNSLPSVTDGHLAAAGLTREDIDIWAVHPGGTKILEAVQNSLSLKDNQLSHSWDVLKEYGNMLSCAVLFVLERHIYACRHGGNPKEAVEMTEHTAKIQNSNGKQGLAFSFSPGIGTEMLHFEIGA